MLPEEVLADAFAYFSRVELISSIYLVNRLYHKVANEHASVRSVLRLHQIATRSRVSKVDDERLSVATVEAEEKGTSLVKLNETGALFVYGSDTDESYTAVIRSPSEIPLHLATWHRFDYAYINHHDVSPTTLDTLRQLAPALAQAALRYDWYHCSTVGKGIASTTASEIISLPLSTINYSQMSALLFNQLLAVFSHGERFTLAGYCLQNTVTSSIPSKLPLSPSATTSLLTLPAVLCRRYMCLKFAHSHHEPPRVSSYHDHAVM